MTSSEIKRKLAALDKKELLSIFYEVLSLRKENEEWLDKKLAGVNSPETIDYFKKKIRKCIFNGKKPDLQGAKKAISDFRKIYNKEEHIIDLMIFYVEIGTELSDKYGDMYEQFYTTVNQNNLSVYCLANQQR